VRSHLLGTERQENSVGIVISMKKLSFGTRLNSAIIMPTRYACWSNNAAFSHLDKVCPPGHEGKRQVAMQNSLMIVSLAFLLVIRR
jgi:hypothetical protein